MSKTEWALEITGISSLNAEKEQIGSNSVLGLVEYHRILANYVGASEFDSNKFENKQYISRGLYGSVYKYNGPNGVIALKKSWVDFNTLTMDLLSYREILIMKQIPEHPGICKFIAAYYDSDKMYLEMEYCEGDYMKTDGNYGNPAGLAALMISPVRFLHKNGFAHLDLNLANFIYNGWRKITVKLVDFGTTRKIDGTERVDKEMVCGLEYKFPKIWDANEQYVSGEILYCADAWALGIGILWISTGVYYTEYPEHRKEAKKIDYSFTDIRNDEIRAMLKVLLDPENPTLPEN